MGNKTPGFAGITVISITCCAVGWIITLVTGSFIHWPFLLGGLIVGSWAVQSINR